MSPLVVLGAAAPSDARALVAYLEEVFQEPHLYLASTWSELGLTVEREVRLIEQMSADPSSLLLLARGEEGGDIVGVLTLQGGRRSSDRHTATLGMTVRQPWRGRGVGRVLVCEAQRFVARHPVLRRLQLSVVADNGPAVALYRKCAFVEEGLRLGAVHLRGRDFDELLMSWNPGVAR